MLNFLIVLSAFWLICGFLAFHIDWLYCKFSNESKNKWTRERRLTSLVASVLYGPIALYVLLIEEFPILLDNILEHPKVKEYLDKEVKY